MDKDAVISALSALAQDTRLELFRLLVGRGPQGLAAGAIADALGVLPSSLSFHLQQLTHAGLIKKRRSSRLLIYSANLENMRDLMGFLTENCCDGHPELCFPAQGAAAEPAIPSEDARCGGPGEACCDGGSE